MNGFNAAPLVNILGFTIGVALYALLGIMVSRYRRVVASSGTSGLLLLTASLGLIWNLGELFVVIQTDFTGHGPTSVVAALSYSALGFLPSVVVHSAQVGSRTTWLTYTSYGASVAAAALHFSSLILTGTTPSYYGLIILTIGSVLLAVGLSIVNFRQAFESKAVFAAALLVFALSALHLSGDGEESSWIVELVAHQSSLPLVLVILYQNYKFAFADLFLKRAISLVLLALVALGLYSFVAAPMLRYHESHDRNDALAISLIITLWIVTALVYPKLHELAGWLVDRVILRRADYSELQRRMASDLEQCGSVVECLELVGRGLASTLTADDFQVTAVPETGIRHEEVTKTALDRIEMTIPTAEPGFYKVTFSGISGGRRLLSEEKAMISAVALTAARRIDALRISHERYEREYREREFSRLATEAQLTALRSQVNPHFLFNALTTIGYLIRNSPEKAFQTLLHLTKLLRGVLTATTEFTSLRDELTLIESYLDIERARFEERLAVVIDVPAKLESVRIPSLLIQPLVENAIKHAVSENRAGGSVTIEARSVDANTLMLTVADTGAGLVKDEPGDGTGLANIRERLAAYYGDKADLDVKISPDGTVATIRLPIEIEKPALRAA